MSVTAVREITLQMNVFTRKIVDSTVTDFVISRKLVDHRRRTTDRINLKSMIATEMTMVNGTSSAHH